MIAALYVERGGAYYGLPGVDPWDEERDARNYMGPHPVVAHPPCSRWCMLSGLIQKRWGHRIGDDGGCFRAALAAVRVWGGILEHPAESKAWPAHRLPRPALGRWIEDSRGGAVTEVQQGAYGHPARKRTWLYSARAALPDLNWTTPEPRACVSYAANNRPPELARLTKREAKATPPAFRDLLVSIAQSARR